jgi:hypothetical protein
VDRPADFDPRNRFEGWDQALRQMYAEVAGELHEALGYSLEPTGTATPAVRTRVLRYRAELAGDRARRAVRRAGRLGRRLRTGSG